MRPGCTGQGVKNGALTPKPVRPAWPRRPAKPFVVHVDVDGTLMVMRDSGSIPYDDPAALVEHQVPNEAVVDRVRSLEAAGFEIRFLTGRGEATRDATVQQLEDAGFRGVCGRLVMQDEWAGWQAVFEHKRDEHADWQAVLSIADQDVDVQAAAAAGTAFMHSDVFAAGEPLNHLFCWNCGCTQLRACPGGCAWANGRVCTTCARGDTATLDAFADTRTETPVSNLDGGAQR